MRLLMQKLAASGSWVLSVEILNWIFDYPLYAYVIFALGPVKGGVLMTVMALILNFGLVRAYAKSKYDWYGFEWLRLQEDKSGKGFIGKLLRMGKVPAFVFLSWRDPFKAYIFARGKNGLASKTDWVWFLGANILGNLIWIGMLSVGFEIIKNLWN